LKGVRAVGLLMRQQPECFNWYDFQRFLGFGDCRVAGKKSA